MNQIEIPASVLACVKNHPDPYIPKIAGLLVATTNLLNGIVERLDRPITANEITGDKIGIHFVESQATEKLVELKKFVTEWRARYFDGEAGPRSPNIVLEFVDKLLEKIDE